MLAYHRIISLSLFLLANLLAFGQSHNPLLPPNTFANQDNPYYWQNKLPHPGYWQQDVHYSIQAEVDDETDIISGDEKLIYWNHSPDTLAFVYFHLYQNAFQPESYYHHLHLANQQEPAYGTYEASGLGTEIQNLTANGYSCETELDNTVLKVILPEPLAPGSSITFEMKFQTYFQAGGQMRRRMKTFNSFGYKHYDGVHWYPRIACYDRKFGWTTDQHLGKEFYGDFGTYDVELTFSEPFIVEATGFMMNREEMLPPALMEKLDIRQYANKPWNEYPSEIIPPSSAKKTWKFHAENVHDFAFTADPTYRIGVAEWDGIKCYSLAQEPHASRWQDAADYTAKVVETYSNDIGKYGYHKMIVADANDGMEYPMLTLDGGRSPDYKGLLAHEIGHNWFFGMLGTNETYRAFMDEGFTQFLTAWSQENIDGDTIEYSPSKSNYVNKYTDPVLVRDRVAYRGYVRDVVSGNDHPLNTHSTEFNSALRHGGGYSLVYYKTAVMLYNLQYVLGDELFLNAMQHYFHQWSMAHPYPEDFRNSVIRYTGVDLNWFFDAWLETTRYVDYKVGTISPSRVTKDGEMMEYTIEFERLGDLHMPVDFTVYTDSGAFDFHIPNTWFIKETDAAVLPKWTSSGKLLPTYQANIRIPYPIRGLRIDPSDRLADVNLLNNSVTLPVKYGFDAGIYNYPDRRNYTIDTRPTMWYNGVDGIKAGVHAKGGLMNQWHAFEADVWMNFRVGQQEYANLNIGQLAPISFQIKYDTPLSWPDKGKSAFADIRYLDGLQHYLAGFAFDINGEQTQLRTYYKSLHRSQTSDLLYLLRTDEWEIGKWNNTVNVEFAHRYHYMKGNGAIETGVKTASPGSDFAYGLAFIEAVNKNVLGKFNINTRFYAQYGSGSNWAKASMLNAAGANQEELMDSKFTRSSGLWPTSWSDNPGATIGHFQAGGGLNLRGYNGYLMPETDANGNQVPGYISGSGLATSIEIDMRHYLNLLPWRWRRYVDIQPYLFADAGVLDLQPNSSVVDWSQLRADAGPGVWLTIRKWGFLETPEPLTIRFDMPVWLNRYPYQESGNVDWRWLFGVSRSF